MRGCWVRTHVGVSGFCEALVRGDAEARCGSFRKKSELSRVYMGIVGALGNAIIVQGFRSMLGLHVSVGKVTFPHM